MENNGEVSSSAFYRDNPDWADVKPIYPSKEEDGAVRIAVTEQFRDAFAYLRAVLASGEMSSRVFLLTEDCIQLNPANYTLWQFRRELLKKLGIDLRKELKYLDDVIMQTPKNYQVWCDKMSDDIERELDYILEQDVARDTRIEGVQQELTELRAQCNLTLTKLQELPKIAASLLKEGENLSPETVKEELDKLLEPECRAIRTALNPLSEFASRLTETASEVHAKHDEELDEIFAQAQHDDYCMRKLSGKLGVKSTEVVQAVPSTSAQAEAEHATPMETEQGETQQSDFRRAFQLLRADDVSTDVALQPIEFDAVTAAEEERLRERAAATHGTTLTGQGQSLKRFVSHF
ncbi:protein prenyltransferase alpha subunit repeat-containing domain protein [Teladorsagia circumcincta]|uniref:Protein farnesyltransferase/geranylgeranyltransferase type-1 subunit alpha n=1 Tax=Teladorsagia circumcincta TaxID=45464 RepID=A0A2G9U5D6_TELCI|nr:protein prenyltransferase alpha subunit repeat-containing domain protein [Teladorsagia circumcincta]